MRERLPGIMLLLLLVVLLTLAFNIHTVRAESYTNVTVEEAKSMIDSNSSLVVLDVRAQSEYDSGHIRNAKLIPVTELDERLDELNKTDDILVYCRLGGRSATASQILVDNGFLYVFNMLGGITAWIGEGYPVYIKYSSIQEAINNADEGETIYVSSGTYHENLIVNKTVSLIGEKKETTIIDGGGIDETVFIKADYVTISEFTLQSTNGGIFTNNSKECAIQGVVVSGNLGIHFENVNNSSISGSRIMNCHSSFAVRLDASYGNTITDSIVDNSIGGIYLNTSSAGNDIVNCTILNNTWGIIIHMSELNSIVNNRIVSNDIGITLEYNIQWNEFYHNNFINNSVQAKIVESTDNRWDNGCEGNYWGNYNGSDLDGDGIGDEYLPWEGVDNYPLMNLYWNPSDINHDLKVDMRDIGMAARAFGSQPGHERWNCHADITGLEHLVPDGKIDMRDIGLIARHFGERYP